MKNQVLGILAAFGLMAGLSSCSTLTFEASMPKQSRVLEEFPEEYRGTYENADQADEQVVVSKAKFEYGEFTGVLGENVSLKPYQHYMVLNILDAEAGYWVIYLVERSKNGDLIMRTVEEEGLLDRVSAITDAEAFYDENGELQRIQVDPSDPEFQKMVESGMWSQTATFKRVK